MSDLIIEYPNISGVVFILKRKKINISITEENHCYENALAERVNGVLGQDIMKDCNILFYLLSFIKFNQSKMKKGLLTLFVLLIFISCHDDKIEKGRILIIVSNTEDMGDPEKHFAGNNLWEVAPPYHIFVSHGYKVDFVSPTVGKVPFSMDPVGISSYTIKYENFNGNVENSLTPDLVNYKNYKAVFIGGGYGPLFDVANNKSLLSIIAKIYENGGIVGGCGHGPGAFANVKLSNGDYMVKGKKITGFPNSTEITKSWAKEGTLLPIMLEDQLRKNGSIFQTKKDLNDKHDVVIDKRIVSTMFLPSSAIVAKEMINEIEKTNTNNGYK